MTRRNSPSEHPLHPSAQKFVEAGGAIFECKQNKLPATKHGFHDAKADAEQVVSWKQNATLGLATGRISNLVILDLDRDDERGINGEIWLRDLEIKHGPLPPHPVVRTPRGGSHHYFTYPTDREVRCSAGRVAEGVDVRGDGGYVVAPDSVTPKGRYVWEVDLVDVPPPQAPSWLLDAIAPNSPIPTTPAPIDAGEISDADRELVAETFKHYLDEIECTKEGRRNATLNKFAFLTGKIVGAGALDEEQAGTDLVEASVKAGLTRQEARATVRSAFKAGKRRPWQPRRLNQLLNDLNAQYFFATEGKSAFVFQEDLDPDTGERLLRRLHPGAFKDKFANQIILHGVGGALKQMSLGQAWFTWQGRRQFERVTFLPGKELHPSVYNQWQGFAYDAAVGDCSLYLEFMKAVLADNDEALFNYLIGWGAMAVQHPEKKGEVAIVMQGEKGVGKTFYASHFGELFGAHYVELTQARHLVGHFNAHLETAVVVLADEAYWAGDKQGESTLKALITGDYLLVERKGVDAGRARNFVHLIMASNADWVVPASVDERRFCVLKVSTAHQNDHAYFGALEEQWQNGGREAFLHYLLHFDLTGFNVRRVPQTEALLEQKLQSLGTIDRWFLDGLRNGQFQKSDGWPEWSPTKELFEQYREFCRAENLRIASQEGFGMRLGKLLPPRVDGRPPRTQRQFGEGKRTWGYEFALLAVCRDRFCAAIGFSIEWETAGEVAEAPDPTGGKW